MSDVFFNLDELVVFFIAKNHEFLADLQDEEFILSLAYLSDIFGPFNAFNLSLQGPKRSIIRGEAKGLCSKLELWEKNKYLGFSRMSFLLNKRPDRTSTVM